MDKARWDKLAAAGGIVGVVLFIVAGIVYGSPPGVDDDAASVASFFSDHRDRVLCTVFLQGLGVLAIIWFFAALVQSMREAGEARLATAAFGSFLLAFSMGSISALSRATLAYSIADEGPDLVLPLYHLSLVIDVFASLLGAGVFAAVAGATLRAGILPRWWGWLSALAALLTVLSATALARDGFWSPTGGLSFVGFGVFLVWMLVTSILLTLKLREAPSQAPEPAASM